jgi:hypothetical protein
LCCLSFDLRILISPLASSNSSCNGSWHEISLWYVFIQACTNEDLLICVEKEPKDRGAFFCTRLNLHL